MHGTILVYGNDQMLVATRRLILERAGYTVFTAESLSNAALVLMARQIDVLVLCQTLSDEERGAVLETAHALKPKTRCAALSFDGRDVVTDGVLIHRGLDGPPSLLTAIGRMLGQKTAHPS
jgi:DNA-binding response OmpR family regulator